MNDIVKRVEWNPQASIDKIYDLWTIVEKTRYEIKIELLIAHERYKMSFSEAGKIGANKRWLVKDFTGYETFRRYCEHLPFTRMTAYNIMGLEKPKQITPPMIEGKYRIIYADPPWKYSEAGITGVSNKNEYGHVDKKFPQLSTEELCELQMPEIEDDAVLFMWATSPFLEKSFQVINAWEFEYKASFIWDKIKHNFGYYNSVRHELLLICTKGSCRPDYKKLIDSVQSIERKKHSEKPEEFRDIIDKLYPEGTRIELFARKKVNGWDSWGNEI